MSRDWLVVLLMLTMMLTITSSEKKIKGLSDDVTQLLAQST